MQACHAHLRPVLGSVRSSQLSGRSGSFCDYTGAMKPNKYYQLSPASPIITNVTNHHQRSLCYGLCLLPCIMIFYSPMILMSSKIDMASVENPKDVCNVYRCCDEIYCYVSTIMPGRGETHRWWWWWWGWRGCAAELEWHRGLPRFVRVRVRLSVSGSGSGRARARLGVRIRIRVKIRVRVRIRRGPG